jgi:hypothetical protein
MFLRFLPFREADTEADPQGGSSKVRASDVLEQFGKDAVRLAEKLADVQSDNYRLREERRGLKQQVTEATGKVPAEGTRVLTTDEAKAYDAYVALGKPEEIKRSIDANGVATAELTTLKREKQIRAAAEAAGYKASVLTTLAADLDIQTEAKDGATLVYVVKDGEKTALTDYAKKEWPDFLPALEAKPGGSFAPDINAGARGGHNGPITSDEQRELVKKRMARTF